MNAASPLHREADQPPAPSPARSRREFLTTAARIAGGVGVPAVVSARALGLETRAAAAGERLTLGVIGFGPRCRYVLGEMLAFPDVQCVAIADVQAVQRDAGKTFVDRHYGTTDCRVHRDMRELLARPDIDCVLVATGDRWHGKAAMMAAEAGKDVYCEKPCGLTIDVCRRIAETMRKTGRVFQAGTQRRSVPNFIRVKELVQEGKIGPLTEMHASVYVPSLNNNWLPAQPTPDPEQCDWNAWLGPAPWRPYNAAYLGRGWRGVYDFEAGARLLDWGVHTVDLCQWVKITDAAAHARDFVDCVKTRRAPVCNADVMRRSHVVAHAAANSWILGRSLGFDPVAETFTSGGKPDAEANGLCRRPEREVWA